MKIKIKKPVHIFFISLFFFSFGSTQRLERQEFISERHSNGLKKLVNVFEGTGLNETLIGKYGFYDTGIKKFVELYKNNRKDGKSIYWYENGNKEKEYNYLEGKLDGIQYEWHDGGQKLSEFSYKNDKLHGESISWYKNGNEEEVYIYVDGELNGFQSRWYKNGQKLGEGTFISGKENGLFTHWFKNGLIKNKIKYENGIKTVERIYSLHQNARQILVLLHQ